MSFLNHWCNILGVDVNSWDKNILKNKSNPSILPASVPIMRFTNKFISNPKQPFQLFPIFFFWQVRRLILLLNYLPQGLSNHTKKRAIPLEGVENFASVCHESNRLLEKLINRDLRSIGYP